MNNVEVARTLSWRENVLFEGREKNVFVKPNEQRRACSDIVMARKRTFRGTKKNLSSATEKLNDAKSVLNHNRRNAQAPHIMMPGQKEGKLCKAHLQGRYPLLGVAWVLF